MSRIGLLAGLCALMATGAHATSGGDVAPVKKVEVFVSPYYDSGTGSRPVKVAVGADFDQLLSSDEKKDILAARDLIEARADVVTPMTLMVLAIRLYDVGLRDDAVYWYYVGRYRFLTLISVLDDPQIAPAVQASRDFISTAGPMLNTYAFCDFAKQAAASAKAVDWVEKHPYIVLFRTELAALPGNREDNLREAIQKIRGMLATEKGQLADPKEIAQFKRMRSKDHLDEQFCW